MTRSENPLDIPGTPDDPDAAPAPAPRRVPRVFWLAELLPFRWRYVWILFVVAITPFALWLHLPKVFAVVDVLTLAAIYAVQLSRARIRIGLLRWGRVATVVGTETLTRATYFGRNTWYNVHLPQAHGWTVTRRRWSGPNTRTAVRYTLDDRPGEIVVRGRQYVDGVILADERDPARARCVSSFTYDLDRDESGNWAGGLRRDLRAGMACWLVIVIGWLALAAVAASGFPTDFTGSSPPAAVPAAGTLQVSGTDTNRTVPCNNGYISVSGTNNTITVTGHCTSVSVSGTDNRVGVDSTDAVSTSGRDNVVTYHWGSPKIVDAGTSNTIRQG